MAMGSINEQTADTYNPEKLGMGKEWDDLTVEQKLERTRIHVKGVEADIQKLRTDVETLFQHAHDVDGKLIIVLNREDRWKFNVFQGGLTATPSNKDF